MNAYASMTWNPGSVSRPTRKGYRRPIGFAIPVVFKPAKKPATVVGTVRIVKGK
jgi:hypothetical protein